MFEKPTALEFARHHDLRISESTDLSYMAGESFVPFVLDEMAEIAREYPIVFPIGRGDIPHAVISIQPGHAAYLGEKGRWLAQYVPAYVRCYPFRFGRVPGAGPADARRLAVFFDPAAPHFHGSEGLAVFAQDGQFSDHMKRRVALLDAVERGVARTQRVVQALAAHGLLVEQSIDITTGANSRHRIKGVRIIDEKKLNDLSDETAGTLCRTGAFPLVYAHLLSRTNFRHGPLTTMPSPRGGDAQSSRANRFFGDAASLDFSNL